nr:DNA-formamidopyrimidine glycosylase [Pseudonocardiales bacterium]
MPELPEVEVVRRGLADHVQGRRVVRVDVFHPRSVRRHVAGDLDFAGRLVGHTVGGVRRRGKYLWLELDDAAPGSDALLGHLGMSGQLLLQDESAPDPVHLRVRVVFADGGPELRFVDQRTFGGLSVDELVGADAADSGETVPRAVAHIARDPLDPAFDVEATVSAMRRKRTGLKRALLDQTLVSGIGNIYADEALWRARLHGARPTA